MIREYLRYKKAKKRVNTLMNLDSSAVIKDFILDSRLLEAQQLGALLGLSEITEDDIVASESRARQVAHLMPIVAYFASTLATAVMEYYDTVSPWRGELDDEEKTALETWVAKVSLSCALGALSQLSSLELIKVVR